MENELLINFFIASCISADANVDNKDREENIAHLKSFIEQAGKKEIAATEHQVEIARQGIEMLKKEIENDNIQ